MLRKTASKAVFLFEGKSIIQKFSKMPLLAIIMAVKQIKQERTILNKITLALIIAKPGHLRNSLQSLLRTIPQIEILAESNDPSVMLKMDEELQPDLIVVDGGLFEETNWSCVEKIKAARAGTKVLVLTDDDQQGQAAKKAGADYCLLKGFPATELARLIEHSLIHGPENKPASSSTK